jgi:hypothetical protein
MPVTAKRVLKSLLPKVKRSDALFGVAGGAGAAEGAGGENPALADVSNPWTRAAAGAADILVGSGAGSAAATGGRSYTPTSEYEARGLGSARPAGSNLGRLGQDVLTRAYGTGEDTLNEYAGLGEQILDLPNQEWPTLRKGIRNVLPPPLRLGYDYLQQNKKPESPDFRIPTGRETYDYYAGKLGYAQGGRVKQGLRQGFEKGGRAELLKLMLEKLGKPGVKQLRRAHSLSRAGQPGPSSAGLRDADRPAQDWIDVTRTSGVRPKTPPSRKMGTIEGDVRKAPPEYVGSKAASQPKQEMGTAETRREDIKIPKPGLRERVQTKATAFIDKAKARFTSKKTPTVPGEAGEEAAKIKKSFTRAAGNWAANKAALPVAGYTAYQLGTSGLNPLKPAGEAVSEWTRNAGEGLRNVLAGEKVDPYTGAPLGDTGRITPQEQPQQQQQQPSTQPPARLTPEQQAQQQQQEQIRRTAASMGLPTDPASAPYNFRGDEKLRGDVMRGRMTVSPGTQVNVGDFGGNADIFASRSGDTQGRANVFSGVGGLRAGPAGSPDVTPEMRERATALAQREAGQLTTSIQARLASGHPDDLEQARQLAVTPEHQALIGQAERYASLERGATGKFGRQRLLEHERGLREAQHAAPARELAMRKYLSGQQQQTFENQIRAVKTMADIKKINSDLEGTDMKRVYTNIDALIPAELDGKPNRENLAFKLIVNRTLGDSDIPASRIRPEMTARMYDDFKTAQAVNPGIIEKIIGDPRIASRLIDVQALGIEPGYTEPQVRLAGGRTIPASEAASVPGSGFPLPFFGNRLFATRDPSREQRLIELGLRQ